MDQVGDGREGSQSDVRTGCRIMTKTGRGGGNGLAERAIDLYLRAVCVHRVYNYITVTGRA